MFALRKDERKLQYSRSNILGFINTGYFTSDNVADGIKNATHNTFSNFRKKLATEIKIHIQLFSEMAKHKRLFNMYSYLMHEQKLPLYHYFRFSILETHTHFTNLKKSTKNRNGTDQNSNTIKTNNF
jgi:hypothetical protein